MTAKKRKRLVERGWAVQVGHPHNPETATYGKWWAVLRSRKFAESWADLFDPEVNTRIVAVEIRELPPVRKPRKAVRR